MTVEEHMNLWNRIDQMNPEEFREAILKSAALVRGLPVWTQAGIALSGNFEGGENDPP